jgi:hypothetical protein
VQGPPRPQGTQGGTLLIDANGKTVGSIYINGFAQQFYSGLHAVLQQIGGIWVELPVTDFTSGFTSSSDGSNLLYYYQSTDCTGQAYIYVNHAYETSAAPAVAIVTTIPPATAPSIYFAGTPVTGIITNSARGPASTECVVASANQYAYMGPVQIYPVSSLGFTPPFHLQ